MGWPLRMFPKQLALIGGAAAAICAGVYVFFGPNDKQKSKKKGNRKNFILNEFRVDVRDHCHVSVIH